MHDLDFQKLLRPSLSAASRPKKACPARQEVDL